MKETPPRQVFYYHFKTNWIWFILTLILFLFMLHCVVYYPVLIYWWQTWGLIGSCVYSFALWAFKYLIKHEMVVIDHNYIKIDHCRPLPWRMIAFAEIKNAQCCLKKLPIIVLRTKKPIKYKFNLMQKLCAKTDFTPFSIALYALKPEDANLIMAIIVRKIGLF